MKRPVRVAVLHDHPAVLRRLEAMIAAEADLDVVGLAASEGQLWPLLVRKRPDVVLLDLHHRGRDGVALCFEIKRWPGSPAIAVFTGPIDEELVVAAALAGAGAVVEKSSSAAVVLATIRDLARSPRTLLDVSPSTLRAIGDRLDVDDDPVLAMRVAGAHPISIARALELAPSAVTGRIETMIAQLERLREAS
jgi:two-component system response regulator DevR